MKRLTPEKMISTALLLLLLASVCGCSAGSAQNPGAGGLNDPGNNESSPDVNESTPPEPTGDPIPLSESVDTFNWSLYDTFDTSANIFYSPLSLESALSTALYGAREDTYTELSAALDIPDIGSFMNDYRSLSSGYSDKGSKLTIANSLWIDESFEKEYGTNPAFISKLEEKMDAEVKYEDFKNNPGKASSDITKWVKKQTEGLIPDYRSISTEDTVLDIINAIYFYGEWLHKFESKDTYKTDFRSKDGNVSVDMMNMNEEYFRYYYDDDLKGIELPYDGEKAVMDIILTKDDDDLSTPDAVKALSFEERDAFISSISSAEEKKISSLRIPKFTMELDVEGLKEKLGTLGIKSAFIPGKADFSGIAKNLYISDIAHRAKIEVDEEGSRAAAVTEMTMDLAAAFVEEEERIDFVCDRPFVFVIRDTETGTILFTGVVNKP